MYLPFFGLSEKPFAITPDPRYLFLGERHAEALAHLVYGITEAGGFIQLTGEVGTGKTTIIRSLLARQPDNAEIALILNPGMTAPEFLLTICEELGIMVPNDAIGSVKDLVDILNTYLLKAHARGKRVVLVIDEAQGLSPALLEQVRLLTNLETDTQKLLQIILIGQPELRDLLARNDLRQLAQRVTGRYHLDPLSRSESAAYIKHRLRIAGATSDIFTGGALSELYRASGGIPRLLNIISDRALLGGYTEDRHEITGAMVRRAASEVFDKRLTPSWLPWVLGTATFLIVASGALVAWSLYQRSLEVVPPPAPPVAAQVVEPAPAPEPVVAPPAPDLATLLRDSAAATGLDGAYAKLFSLWSATYVPGSEDACSQALRQGLECLNEEGGFDMLRRFNRPAILSVSDANGTVHQVVVARMTQDTAQLMIGDTTHDIAVADLAEHWRGDFQLLWKPPQLDTRNLSLGMQGEPIGVLRNRLRQWAGLAPDPAPNQVFEASLETLVKQFQLRSGLPADGVAGVQTQAVLDSAMAGVDSPLLSAVTP